MTSKTEFRFSKLKSIVVHNLWRFTNFVVCLCCRHAALSELRAPVSRTPVYVMPPSPAVRRMPSLPAGILLRSGCRTMWRMLQTQTHASLQCRRSGQRSRDTDHSVRTIVRRIYREQWRRHTQHRRRLPTTVQVHPPFFVSSV